MGSHILYCVGLKGNFGGDLSGCVAFRSKAKTAPLDEAAVATVTAAVSCGLANAVLLSSLLVGS